MMMGGCEQVCLLCIVRDKDNVASHHYTAIRQISLATHFQAMFIADLGRCAFNIIAEAMLMPEIVCEASSS